MPILIWRLIDPLISILAKFGLAAVIFPVSVADKANMTVLTFDIILT